MATQIVLSVGGINWTWYLWGTLEDDGRITVTRYDRLHNYDLDRNGEEHPTVDGAVNRMIESNGRVLTGVQWYWRNDNNINQSDVTNPGYIFDYK